jgi:hypothetical protein
VKSLSSNQGLTKACKKNGEVYYRAGITYRNKHISLGSFNDITLGNKAYETANAILREGMYTLSDYDKAFGLPFEKWVILINYRDNGIYIRNPIYLRKNYFLYYIGKDNFYLFDTDDLFYYGHHKIMIRGGHLFVSDYGMQVSILSRYGIKNYAVAGKDYRFINGNEHDLRYSNIEVINQYHGVSFSKWKGQPCYVAKIHIEGDYVVGRYPTEKEAAIAYNKAADTLRRSGFLKNFPINYVAEADEIEYAKLYHKLRISRNIRMFAENFKERADK